MWIDTAGRIPSYGCPSTRKERGEPPGRLVANTVMGTDRNRRSGPSQGETGRVVDVRTSARQGAADYYGVSQEDVAAIPLAPLCSGEEDGQMCIRRQGHQGPHRARPFIDHSPHPLIWGVTDPGH
jgi:hypothetical protein